MLTQRPMDRDDDEQAAVSAFDGRCEMKDLPFSLPGP